MYLARGKYGRCFQNEEVIVKHLVEEHQFIVLDDCSNLQEVIHYFTHAHIIIGAHGSLLKNIIWCKFNPMIIEFCPRTRHDCFYGNALSLGFNYLFIVTDSNNKEDIYLTQTQLNLFYNLLKIFLQKEDCKFL